MLTTTTAPVAATKNDRAARSRAAAFSLLSARIASVAKLVLADRPLSDPDFAVLEAASAQLLEEADAILFFESDGREGRAPSRRAAVGVGVAALSESAPADEAMLAAFLQRLAGQLQMLASSQEKDVASELLKFFQEVAGLARTQAGSTGERILGRQ